MTSIIRLATTALVAALALAGATGAFAAKGSGGGGGSEVLVFGTCTGGSSVKLKLKTEDNGIEVDGEVDQSRNGVAWNWQISRGGATLATGTATTRAPSGSFSVERIVSNNAGADTITFTASRAGESCSATATL